MTAGPPRLDPNMSGGVHFTGNRPTVGRLAERWPRMRAGDTPLSRRFLRRSWSCVHDGVNIPVSRNLAGEEWGVAVDAQLEGSYKEG
jgi:hypothetical protein